MEIYEKYNLMDKPRVLIVMKSVMTKKTDKKTWILFLLIPARHLGPIMHCVLLGSNLLELQSVSEKDSVKCTTNPKINDNGNRPDQGS